MIIPDGNGGYENSICSPSTPERFQQYEIEMEASFSKLIDKLVSFYQYKNTLTHDNIKNSLKISSDLLVEKKEEIVKLSLELFYYWVNFAPLTRGTSATGYASFMSFILAVDNDILGD